MSSSDVKELMREKTSLWDKLRIINKPIVLYGTGDGAAKIMTVLESRGIAFHDIFVSDDFYRGQSFCGRKVKTCGMIEKEYGDFVILVCFASKLGEVMDRINEYSRRHELYIPDVNVYGDVCEIFDDAYIEKNSENLSKVFSMISSERSREFFITLLDYKYSGKPGYVYALDALSDDNVPDDSNFTTFCDFGAYTGDTVRSYTKRFPSIKNVFAFEPEKKSFEKLSAYCDSEEFSASGRKAVLINGAAWHENGKLGILDDKGRGASLESATGEKYPLHSVRRRAITAIRPDGVFEGYPECFSGKGGVVMKYDVEGCERQALSGSARTIAGCRPTVFLSCYHKNEDLLLPLFVKENIASGFECRMRRAQRCIPAWETEFVLTFV